MRFLADEGISPATIAWLRAQDHQVISVREQAILLTRADLSRISYLAGEPHYGIILLRPGKNETAEHVNAMLMRFFQMHAGIDLAKRIAAITPKRIRFRPRLEK